jgi:hypothetical protein
MRKIVMLAAVAAMTAGVYGCGGETRTIVRKETTTSVPAPVVVERRTVIESAPEVQEQRVYKETERRTVIEE